MISDVLDLITLLLLLSDIPRSHAGYAYVGAYPERGEAYPAHMHESHGESHGTHTRQISVLHPSTYPADAHTQVPCILPPFKRWPPGAHALKISSYGQQALVLSLTHPPIHSLFYSIFLPFLTAASKHAQTLSNLQQRELKKGVFNRVHYGMH